MRLLLITIMVMVLAGCTNIKEQKISKENVVKIQNKVLAGKGLKPEEVQYFLLGASAMVKEKGNVFGKTVGEVIEEGKKVPAPVNARNIPSTSPATPAQGGQNAPNGAAPVRIVLPTASGGSQKPASK